MTWTYLTARSANVVASPVPTTTQFAVTAGYGVKFQIGPATVSGYSTAIGTIAGDLITLSTAIPFPPAAGDEISQALLDQKDQVRLLIGDTDSADQQLQDEEIAFYLGQQPNPFRAAAECASALVAKYTRRTDYELSREMREMLSQRVAQYKSLADTLFKKAARANVYPVAGGISQSQKQQVEGDLDREVPFFTREGMTEPGTDPDTPPPTWQPLY